MAMSTLSLLLLLFCLAATASARPCNTIFFFSATTTTSTTYYPSISLPRNANPNTLLQNPRYLTLIFTTTTTSRFLNHRPSLNFNSNNPIDEDSESSSMMTSSYLPLKFYSSVSNSIRDRTRDIMSVVWALLFGVVCGAITAAIMYFVWALFTPRRFDFDYISSSSDDDDDDDYDEDDVTASKKFGYVAIPEKPKAVDDDLKKTAPPEMV